MDKKGQALVEFIIVLPIFLLIVLAVLDVVNIFRTKMELENLIEDVILGDENSLPKNVILLKEETAEDITYQLKETIDIVSPFLHSIIDDPYPVIIERVVPNE